MADTYGFSEEGTKRVISSTKKVEAQQARNKLFPHKVAQLVNGVTAELTVDNGSGNYDAAERRWDGSAWQAGNRTFNAANAGAIEELNGVAGISTGVYVNVYPTGDYTNVKAQWIFADPTGRTGELAAISGALGDHKFLIESADPVAGYWDAKINNESGSSPGSEAVAISWVRGDGGASADTVDMYCDFSTVNGYNAADDTLFLGLTGGDLQWKTP